MDETAMVKREVQRSEWEQKIQNCQNSGMSVQRWCSANDIRPKTYYYHLRKLREQVPEQIPVPLADLPSGNTPAITIRSGDCIVEMADGLSPDTLTAIIRAMKC